MPPRNNSNALAASRSAVRPLPIQQERLAAAYPVGRRADGAARQFAAQSVLRNHLGHQRTCAAIEGWCASTVIAIGNRSSSLNQVIHRGGIQAGQDGDGNTKCPGAPAGPRRPGLRGRCCPSRRWRYSDPSAMTCNRQVRIRRRIPGPSGFVFAQAIIYRSAGPRSSGRARLPKIGAGRSPSGRAACRITPMSSSPKCDAPLCHIPRRRPPPGF